MTCMKGRSNRVHALHPISMLTVVFCALKKDEGLLEKCYGFGRPLLVVAVWH